jgi:hypothetical protein
MKLTARAKKSDLRDPETKSPLGESTRVIGDLQVTMVANEFSIATIIKGGKGLKVGDRVEVPQVDR